MKAMILAAGLGQRMRPLTDHLPKPLLEVGGKPLLQYHLEALQVAGVENVIINLAYLGDKIRAFVGDGSRFGLQVEYSVEPEPLETGGALLQALPLLGTESFLLINGDVWSEFSLASLIHRKLSPSQLGHLVLVPNPDFHPVGDFALAESGFLMNGPLMNGPDVTRYTFAGISLLSPEIIRSYPDARDKFPLGEVLRYGINEKKLTGEVFAGRWSDVGTPERLLALQEILSGQ